MFINSIFFIHSMPVFDLEAVDNPTAKYKDCIQAARFRIKWKDIFNVKMFYKAMHFWFEEYEYKDMEEHIDHYETQYFEKINVFGDKELWLRWRVQKEINKYFKYHIDLDYHFLYLVPTEVVRDGKKFKKDVYKGEVEVWVTALLEVDWQNKWAKHWFLKRFHKMFRERIFRTQIYDEHKRELYREAYVMQNYMKHWFKMKRYLPYEEIELFTIPSHAYPTHSGGDKS